MSLPQRPDASSSRRDDRHVFRESSRRHRRPSDVESRPSHSHRRTSSKGKSHSLSSRPLPSPGTPVPMDRDPMMNHGRRTSGSQELSRKRSLVRPERQRIDENHPNYHYRKHAQKMTVHPSTTGNDPIREDYMDEETVSSDATDLKPPHLRNASGGGYHDTQAPLGRGNDDEKADRRLSRSKTMEKLEKQRQKERDALRPPSLWNVYCAVITFWMPGALLACFGKPQKAQQRAWREKMGLCSLILMICTIVGYITFGFQQTVCPAGAVRLQNNKVGEGYLIIHGEAYDLTGSKHPLAAGIPDESNILYLPGEKYGGKDASFMFQNVNGACKGLITKAPNSPITTNAAGDLSWYFPCNAFNQDGSSKPNQTIGRYDGYKCHLSDKARRAQYSLHSAGDVYFTWDDIKNSTRNLMVWNGDVLDLDLLNWFNRTQVNIPDRFDQIRQNPAVKGVDVTRAFASAYEKQVAKCFTQIIKVGSVDTETIGCIASKVVLYVSLIFILAVVAAKFVLALAFQWFISKQFGATKTSLGKTDSKERKQQIEEWSDDIYRAPPKLMDSTGPDRMSKRGSMLPATSRFTSPYAVENTTKTRAPPTTMTSQSTSSRLMSSQGGSGMYRQLNASHGTLPAYGGKASGQESRSGLLISPTADQNRYSVMDVDGPGPAGFIHEAVVPQPPPEWQPFGYPLAHTICLVTAYSEGADGLRTTLDSIATTDFPNSHKLILVICDGMIKGEGEDLTTPEVALGMMKDHAVLPHEVKAFSYVAVASGSKRHNMAKIYSGFYDYGEQPRIPSEKQQRVPMMIVVKCGTPDEAKKSKPGNRGKRDSQIILMSFLQKVMFDERMTELEFEMFNGIWKITGISPDFYEIVLMVDADTKVFPDSLTHMISAMVKDPDIMGLCGETKIANKRDSWVSMIQVFEYFISHHLAKSFESVFGGVTCLPGCFCMYRIKAPKGGQNYWVPILANPDVVEHYSENVVDTLHKKNLLLLGEDRYLSTLMLKTFPKRKQVFVPQAVCKTTVPEQFSVLLSQRRRWINSTVHNLMELVLVRDLCGTFCFSMQFVVFVELMGTLVLPAAIAFTFYLIAISIKAAVTHTTAPLIPLVLLALILGLPAILIVITAHRWSYVGWMFVYLLSLPVWNFVLPTYAFWKFDDFSWGDTRKTAGEKTKKAGLEYEGEFDSSKITMKRWHDFEAERRLKTPNGSNTGGGWAQQSTTSGGWTSQQTQSHGYFSSHYVD